MDQQWVRKFEYFGNLDFWGSRGGDEKSESYETKFVSKSNMPRALNSANHMGYLKIMSDAPYAHIEVTDRFWGKEEVQLAMKRWGNC